MSTISSVGGVTSSWASAIAQRTQRSSQMAERLLSKIDADGSGNVSSSELQGLMEDMSKKTGTASNASAADVLKKFDANADGSLNADELGQTMQSMMPPPSTMAFAQSRSVSSTGTDSVSANGRSSDDLYSKVDSDSDGAVSKTELQGLLEKMSGGTASQTGVNSDELFGQLDTDGDGSLSQAEFDADRPTQDGRVGDSSGLQSMGGMPPPPQGPGGPSGPPPVASGKTGDTTNASANYDPLDTNEDGVVSAAERLTGASASQKQDSVQALFKSIDTDGDSKISDAESQAFVADLTSRLKQSDSSAASISSSNGKSTQGSSDQRTDLARLADIARRLYETNADQTATARGSTSSLNAMA